jgi:hypothetical protein
MPSPAPLSATTSPSDTPQKPRSILQRFLHLWNEYGYYALALYTSMWVVPLATMYETFYYFDNFGHNPASILQLVGMKDMVFAWMELSPDARPERYQISMIYAYLGSEIIEPLRFGATLFLAPRLKAWWEKGRVDAVSSSPRVDETQATTETRAKSPGPESTPAAAESAAVPKAAKTQRATRSSKNVFKS